MSFLTSFCDLPQKEQQSVWFSRLSTKCSAFQAPPGRRPGRRPPQPFLRLRTYKITLLWHAGRFLDDDFVDEAVLLGLTRAHEVVAVGVLLDPIERLAS